MMSLAHSLESHEDNGRNGTSEVAARSQFKRLLVAWAIGLLAYLAITGTGWFSYRAVVVVNDIAWTLAAALAALGNLRAAMSLRGTYRAAWLTFALACAAWVGGQLVWNVYELVLGVAIPFPSYADIGYLAFGPLMIVGLLVLRTTQSERELTWLRIANLGLILCSLAVVLITSFTRPFLETQRPFSTTLIVVAENATVTIAFILALYFLWSYRWGRQLPAYALITLALGVHMIAGLLYTREMITAEYGAFSSFNVAWVLGFGLQHIAAAVRVRARSALDDDAVRTLQGSQGWVEAVIPSILVLCIAITASILYREIRPHTVHFGAIVLAAFALMLGVREIGAHLQGQRLRGQLASSEATLRRLNEQLKAMQIQRDELERSIEMTARAGGVGLWEWDLKTNVVHFSKQWKRQLGYEENELPDGFETWRARLHPDDAARALGDLERYLEHPQGDYVCNHRLQHKDGSYLWILSRGRTQLDESGRPVSMRGVHIDVTAFKQLEQSLRESEQQLELRVAQRTQELTDAYRESQSFAYAVAHDLKAPLRAIDGFGALLEQSAGRRLTDEERGYLCRARQGANRLSALIDGLLDYSRIEHREQRLMPVDCSEFVAELLHGMSEAIGEAGALVEVDLDRAPVQADPEALRIVVCNLLDNALKFSDRRRTLRIEITGAVEGDTYLLKVRDNGIGFDSQYQEKIFGIFNRLHASGYEGTGIGLALVRKAVLRMKGAVWAESAAGDGATFFVRLLLAKPR